ncbi:hypothetical protein [Acidiplasma cupricumulans]|uniref:hypothetical protein n=1 Tax=Acidiplasma cupricumulans TaxID=312540 RepID=UPI000A8F2A9B|nr:hypothetical protein [Acidiplasma cupricumulans]
MDIIALALQFNAIIITDDYAIQNVASRLKIKYSGASINEIKREIRWLYRCTGCHKIYNEDIKECPVCGHKLKRFTKNYRFNIFSILSRISLMFSLYFVNSE